jgi:uncharacterized protein (DUF736 family)
VVTCEKRKQVPLSGYYNIAKAHSEVGDGWKYTCGEYGKFLIIDVQQPHFKNLLYFMVLFPSSVASNKSGIEF